MTLIPFNKPYLAGNEFDYIKQAVDQMHISGDGLFTKKCHSLLEKILGVPKVLLTTSCTHALEMSALLLDIQQKMTQNQNKSGGLGGFIEYE